MDFKPHIAWEARTPDGKPLPKNLLNLMADLDIAPIADISLEDPLQQTPTLYTRLFSKPNQLEYDTQTLNTIHKRTHNANPTKAY
jgi:hypothetical protein